MGIIDEGPDTIKEEFENSNCSDRYNCRQETENFFIKNYKIILLYFFSIIFALFLIVIFALMVFGKINLDLSNISLSEITGLIIAFFAIGLSAQFYFKTTDASNLFYVSVFNIISNIGGNLSRIETEFTKRFEKIDKNLDDVVKASSSIALKYESNIDRIKTIDKKIEKSVNEKADELNIEPKTLNTVFEEFLKIENKKQQLLKENEKLLKLDNSQNVKGQYPKWLSYIKRKNPKLINSVLFETRSNFSNNFENNINKYPQVIFEELKNSRIIDSKGKLTDFGYAKIRRLVRHYH